jgi:hypothetical protein
LSILSDGFGWRKLKKKSKVKIIFFIVYCTCVAIQAPVNLLQYYISLIQSNFLQSSVHQLPWCTVLVEADLKW